MKLLHLSSETGLRGGEHQLLLLARQDKPAISEIFGVPKKSGLYDRLPTDAAKVPVDCRGFYDLASVLRLRKLLGSGDIDLVHAHSNRAHKTAIALRPGNRQPLVVSRRNAFRCRGGLIYRAVDRFITVSGAGFLALRDGGVEANRISVIHDAVDEPAMSAARPERLGLADDSMYFLCVAAFTAEKDHATLLKAWDRIAQSNPKAHLLLAGDGPGRAAMEEQARSLPRVRFLGWREDVIPLIKGADIVTLASLNEGLG